MEIKFTEKEIVHKKGSHWLWWIIGWCIPIVNLYVIYRVTKLLEWHTYEKKGR